MYIFYLVVKTKEDADYCVDQVTQYKIKELQRQKLVRNSVTGRTGAVRCDKFSTLGLIIPPEEWEGGGRAYNVASLSAFL